MGLSAAATAGLIAWLVLWAIGVKAVDGFLVTLVVVLVAVTVHMLTPYIPGKRDS